MKVNHIVPLLGLCLLSIGAVASEQEPPADRSSHSVGTFSIVAYDPQTDDLGVAVQSKFLAVGAVVPWAKAGVGAIATQAYANVRYGPRTTKRSLHRPAG